MIWLAVYDKARCLSNACPTAISQQSGASVKIQRYGGHEEMPLVLPWLLLRNGLVVVLSHFSCPQKRSAVKARVRTAATNSSTGTYSSGRWEARTSPGPKSTAGVSPTLTSRRMSAP